MGAALGVAVDTNFYVDGTNVKLHPGLISKEEGVNEVFSFQPPSNIAKSMFNYPTTGTGPYRGIN